MIRLAFPVAAVAAIAVLHAAPASALTVQQELMKTCNADAGEQKLKGTERKTFISGCLKGETSAPGKPLTAQQTKMKTCNTDATTKQLKGKERQTFMSTCLKG